MEKLIQISPIQAEISVYYGSQTGTAAGFAKAIVEEGIQYGVKTKLVDLATFEPSVLLKEKIVVFVIATYGRGGPTDNAKKFYQWLVSAAEIKSESMKNTMFAVFGCGDSGFKFFNKMAKDVAEKFEARGAKNIYAVGTGDASEDIESEFAEWKIGMWEAIKANCKAVHSLDESVTIQPDFTLSFDEKDVDFSKVEFDLTTKQYIDSSNLQW